MTKEYDEDWETPLQMRRLEDALRVCRVALQQSPMVGEVYDKQHAHFQTAAIVEACRALGELP